MEKAKHGLLLTMLMIFIEKNVSHGFIILKPGKGKEKTKRDQNGRRRGKN